MPGKRKATSEISGQQKRQKLLNERDEGGLSSDVEVTSDQVTSNDTIQPGSLPTNIVAKIDFKVGDVVWAKIRGCPFWPAKIERIYGVKLQMIEILWFNDYRRSKVYRTQIESFLPNFRKNSKFFKEKVGLETAAKEAVLYMTSKMELFENI